MAVGLMPMAVLSQNYVPGYSINSSASASMVVTKYGPVAGYIENGIYTYKGIPYAEAGRFEELGIDLSRHRDVRKCYGKNYGNLNDTCA